MAFTAQQLASYFSGQIKHKNYDLTTKLYKKIRIHADGELPDFVMERRPSEPEEIKAYREKIFEPITQETISAVVTSLGKIRRSQDWMVRFKKDVPAIIREAETPEIYWNKNYPYFGSITNYAFTVLLREYLLDANAVCVVMPKEINVEPTEYLQPIALLFNSNQVYDYSHSNYAVLESSEKYEIRIEGGGVAQGKVFYIVDKEEVVKYAQTNATGTFTELFRYPHGLGYCPAFKVKGLFYKHENNDVIYRSRIADMIPHLNEALREYSDLQAEVVQHVFSERWEYRSEECGTCKSSGRPGYVRSGKEGKSFVKCSDCNGTGYAKAGPYAKLVVRPANQAMGETSAPIPPAGYITKNTEIVKIQDERIINHKVRALSAINMQFLSAIKVNQSGIAKEVDRDELNNFVYSIAEDIVAVIDEIIRIGNDYRYMAVVNESERKELLPMIPVPEKYDLLSTSYLMDELTKAINAKVSPVVLSGMMNEFVEKKFYTDDEMRNKLNAVLQLDPLPFMSEDEKVSRLQNKGITKEDYIISSNITSFVTRAISENEDFFDKSFADQYEVMKAYAAEVAAANDSSNMLVELGLQE